MMPKDKYEALTEIEWSDPEHPDKDGRPALRRVHAGDIVDDLPTDSIKPLLAGKAIKKLRG